MVVTSVRVGEVDVGWWLRVLALRLDQTRLEMDDVFPQRIILRLNCLVVVLQRMQFSDLLLEFLDVSFLSLSECSLRRLRKLGFLDDMRIDKARRPSINFNEACPTSINNRRREKQDRNKNRCRKQRNIPVLLDSAQRASTATALAFPLPFGRHPNCRRRRCLRLYSSFLLHRQSPGRCCDRGDLRCSKPGRRCSHEDRVGRY